MATLNIHENSAPSIITGVGALLAILVGAEILLTVSRSGPLAEGWLIGVITSLPFIVGLLYGGYWISSSDLSSNRNGRILRWCIGGFVIFSLINIGLMAALLPESASTIVGWMRWASSLGAGTGLLIGIFEARAIDRALAAERLRLQQEQLERQNSRLEEFASIVSHDLRSPLNTAVGRLSMARNTVENDNLDAAVSALERMNEIIEDTLTLAREGQVIEATTAVDLSELVQQSWHTVDPANATIELKDTVTIEADRERLRHVFENLFRNAVEHGGENVTVQIGLLEDRDGFYVADNGPGIDPDGREQVFDLGYTSASDGTGFGLAIVKRIVEAHGWEIDAGESDSGGARFEVSNVKPTSEVPSSRWKAPVNSLHV